MSSAQKAWGATSIWHGFFFVVVVVVVVVAVVVATSDNPPLAVIHGAVEPGESN